MNLKRETGQDIDEFIDKYDEACSNLRKAGRDLDDETYALQLMESSNLTDDLSHLVISGINDKQSEIFEQTKRAMRKYLGSDKSGLSVTNSQQKEKNDIFSLRKVTNKKKPIIQIKEILINVVDEVVRGVEVVEDVMDVVMVIKGDWREETQTNNNNNKVQTTKINHVDVSLTLRVVMENHKLVTFVGQFFTLQGRMGRTAPNLMKIYKMRIKLTLMKL